MAAKLTDEGYHIAVDDEDRYPTIKLPQAAVSLSAWDESETWSYNTEPLMMMPEIQMPHADLPCLGNGLDRGPAYWLWLSLQLCPGRWLDLWHDLQLY